MISTVESELLREDVIRGLKDRASRGQQLAEMVGFVQTELGLSKNFLVPLLAYFCQAFCLPLAKVLPLREWIDKKDDALIPDLLDRMMRWQFMTVQKFEDRRVTKDELDELIKSNIRKALEKFHVTFYWVASPAGNEIILNGCVAFHDHPIWPTSESNGERKAKFDREWKVSLEKIESFGFIKEAE